MAMDHEQPEDSDASQLSWLLSSAHDAPEMRREFVSELSERLDAEFTARDRAVGTARRCRRAMARQ